MQSIGEIIQTIARQRARGPDAAGGKGAEKDPLLTTLPFEGAPGERIAHLPIDADLSQAWMALTGEPFRPHQAHALTALRRGEPVALRASSADVAMTGFLLLYTTLLADRSATALVLTPDDAALQTARAQLTRINQDLPRSLNLSSTTVEAGRRPDLYARVVFATPEALHGRLLRHHDRAWHLFWPRLRLILIPEIQRYTGVAAAHLADLLIRAQRVAAREGQLPNLLATLEAVAEAEPALASLVGQPWRIVPADDGPRAPSALTVWRGGAARLRDTAEIASAIQRSGYQVHVFCQPFELSLVAPALADLPRITVGPALEAGHALVVAGYPGSHSLLRRMLAAEYQVVVLVLGELPHEQALARRAAALLTDPPPAWVPPAPNAYVLARNVLCAASEQPLTETEVDAWGVGDIVARLVAQEQLVDLPDPEIAWKPTSAAGDPYEDWSLPSSVGEAVAARTERGQVVGAIAPAVYERWAFPGAALPAGAGGYRVHARDEDTGALTLRIESGGRRTYPLRRGQVSVRETRETRVLTGGRPLGWGRVMADEEIYGYREMAVGSAAADVALKPTLSARWTAPACWFDLPGSLQVVGQIAGWSLAAALSLRALAELTDVVPCYDHEARRLYLVDAQPGGSGLAMWVYAHAEELLPLAYDVAYACRNDPLLEPLARVDMDWLLALLGPRPVADERRAPAEVGASAAPRESMPRRQPEPAEPASGQRSVFDSSAPPASAARPIVPERRPEPARPPAERGPGQPPAERRPARSEPIQPPAERAPARPEPAKGQKHGFGNATPAPPSATPAKPPAASAGPLPEPPTSARRPAPGQPHSVDEPPGTRPPPPPEEPAPDAAALIERLRRQREQREGQPARPRPAPDGRAAPAGRVVQRFAAGDRIFCLPYGDGTVRESRVGDGRELLVVEFPDYGELEIDPAVSLVRKLEDASPEEDDLL